MQGLPGGGIDIAFKAVDRHAADSLHDRTALRFVSCSAAPIELSYGELARQTHRFAQVLRGFGIGREARYRNCFAGDLYLTGDLARRDADGYYRFVGRADGVIKSVGHLIGPLEVESVLMEHAAVAEAGGRYDSMRSSAVIGIRLRPLSSAQAKLPKLCITPLGRPVAMEQKLKDQRVGLGSVHSHRMRVWGRTDVVVDPFVARLHAKRRAPRLRSADCLMPDKPAEAQPPSNRAWPP